MFAVDRRLLQNFDWGLGGLALALAGLGVVNLVSAGPESPGEMGSVPLRQLLWVGLGLVTMGVLLVIDYRAWDRLALPVYLSGPERIWPRGNM